MIQEIESRKEKISLENIVDHPTSKNQYSAAQKQKIESVYSAEEISSFWSRIKIKYTAINTDQSHDWGHVRSKINEKAYATKIKELVSNTEKRFLENYSCLNSDLIIPIKDRKKVNDRYDLLDICTFDYIKLISISNDSKIALKTNKIILNYSNFIKSINTAFKAYISISAKLNDGIISKADCISYMSTCDNILADIKRKKDNYRPTLSDALTTFSPSLTSFSFPIRKKNQPFESHPMEEKIKEFKLSLEKFYFDYSNIQKIRNDIKNESQSVLSINEEMQKFMLSPSFEDVCRYSNIINDSNLLLFNTSNYNDENVQNIPVLKQEISERKKIRSELSDSKEKLKKTIDNLINSKINDLKDSANKTPETVAGVNDYIATLEKNKEYIITYRDNFLNEKNIAADILTDISSKVLHYKTVIQKGVELNFGILDLQSKIEKYSGFIKKLENNEMPSDYQRFAVPGKIKPVDFLLEKHVHEYNSAVDVLKGKDTVLDLLIKKYEEKNRPKEEKRNVVYMVASHNEIPEKKEMHFINRNHGNHGSFENRVYNLKLHLMTMELPKNNKFVDLKDSLSERTINESEWESAFDRYCSILGKLKTDKDEDYNYLQKLSVMIKNAIESPILGFSIKGAQKAYELTTTALSNYNINSLQAAHG